MRSDSGTRCLDTAVATLPDSIPLASHWHPIGILLALHWHYLGKEDLAKKLMFKSMHKACTL